MAAIVGAAVTLIAFGLLQGRAGDTGLSAPSRAQHRYELHAVEEIAPANGRVVKSVYRFDTVTGKAWRIGANPVQTNPQDPKAIVIWAEGWEEVPESLDLAVAKAQAEWQRAIAR